MKTLHLFILSVVVAVGALHPTNTWAVPAIDSYEESDSSLGADPLAAAEVCAEENNNGMFDPGLNSQECQVACSGFRDESQFYCLLACNRGGRECGCKTQWALCEALRQDPDFQNAAKICFNFYNRFCSGL